MPTPSLGPMPRVFREAISFHESRISITDREAKRSSSEARARSFYAASLADRASALETHRLIGEAMKNGTTEAQFRADFTRLLAANGGAVLPPSRQNLIFEQAIGLGYASGRIRQMRIVSETTDRIIWMYPLAPHDNRTTQICLSLEGYMAPADSPEWQRIAPPNHFKERHWQLLTLTLEQAKERGYVPRDEDEDPRQYPVIDGEEVHPDSGFDMQPELLASDAENLMDGYKALLGELEAKTAADYELGSLATLEDAEAIELPELATAGEAEAGWEAFREVTDMPDALDSTITVDALGDGVIVNRGTFDAIFAEEPELVSLLPELLSDPTEVWFIPVETAEGIEIVKRYLGVFVDVDGSRTWMWADQSPSGWLARGGFVKSPEELDALRKGYLTASALKTEVDA